MRDTFLWPRVCVWCLALACVVFVAPDALSQVADSAPPGISLEEQVAREVQRLALLELRMQSSPTPDDYELAMRTLELARGLTPDDPELARKIVAAAWGTGDARHLIDATRELVRVDPNDTVAQLRLITAMISRLQTAEERIDLYDRFLSPNGAKLNGAVRSRLAFDAALLLREQGDEERFVEMLDLALSLDGTNKAAAQMALTLYSDRTSDPVGQFEMLLNLLYADPLDPNVYFSIAQELADHSVLTLAERFYSLAVTLYQRSNALPPDIEEKGLALRWQLYGAQSSLDALNFELRKMRSNQQATNEYRLAQGDAPEDLTDPADVRLDPELDKIRALAAMAVGDEESMRAAIVESGASIDEFVIRIMDPVLRPAYIDDQAAARQSVAMLIEMQIYRLWTGVDVEKAKEARESLRESAKNFEVQIGSIDPWIMYRDGDYEGVLNATSNVAIGMGRLTLIVRALSLDAVGRSEEAAQLLFTMAQSDGFSAMSAWARGYAVSLVGPAGLKTVASPGLESLAREVPRYIDEMVSNTTTFMSFSVLSVENPVSAGMPWHVRIRIRNLAPIPLGVGADRPINSRVMLQPHRDSNIGFFFHELYPEVVELNRRLRLEPRESLEALVSVDLGASGIILALNSLSNHRIRWRGLQGFVTAKKSIYLAGPMCQTAEALSVEYRKNRLQSLPQEEVAVTIRSGTTEDLPEVMELTRSVLLAWPLFVPKPQRAIDGLRDAMAARLRSGTQLERAFMLAMLPASELEPAMEPFDVMARALVSETGFRVTEHAELVEALTLITRVIDAQSPMLSDAERNGTSQVSAIARLVRERLAADRPCVARAESIDEWFPSTRKRSE